MPATIAIDDALYARLEGEARRRGQSVPELVTDAVRRVLDDELPPSSPDSPPAWVGMLRRYAHNATDHSLAAMRRSIAVGRFGGDPGADP